MKQEYDFSNAERGKFHAEGADFFNSAGSDRREEIERYLAEIESTHDVRVLFACESGSRAWGFPSPDSDYDVRFIYANKPEWYLAVDLEKKRDVIEIPISDDLDISGWDLRKALGLLQKSNPPLMEWLGSPIVYLNRFDTADEMLKLFPMYFSPVSCGYHYLSMAKKNYRGYLKGDRVRIKKYFYVLRPLLAVRWIEQNKGLVPTEFSRLVEGVLSDVNLRETIHALVEQKRKAFESEYADSIPVLDDFIRSELERLAESEFSKKADQVDAERLNEFFRAHLTTAWAS